MNPVKTQLVAEVFVKAPIEKVWDVWTNPEHIVHWNNISDEWHTPRAENDLRVGGRLFLRMEKKDNSGGFDYECFYDEIVARQKISHTGSDNRKTTILFFVTEDGVKLIETFDPESKTPLDIQQEFCQSILNKFKSYVENYKF
jgi:uncharacterized protein YndB with AHSA1/START domain